MDALMGYLALLVVFALTMLPLVVVLPTAPPLVDGATPPPIFPWHIDFTVTIVRSSPKEQPV